MAFYAIEAAAQRRDIALQYSIPDHRTMPLGGVICHIGESPNREDQVPDYNL